MVGQNDKQDSAQDLLREGYAQAETGRKKSEKIKAPITVELNETEVEMPPVYWMTKWYSANKKEQDK